MQMRIDEGFGHKIAAGIDLPNSPPIKIFGDRHDAAPLDADLSKPIATAEPGAADGNVERLIHGSILIEGAVESFLLLKPTYYFTRDGSLRGIARFHSLSHRYALGILRPASSRAPGRDSTMDPIN
jgi:hypothetical protein